jgi:hypothetical protein
MIDSANLTIEQINELRPEVHRLESEDAEDLLFKKAHDAFTFTSEGQPIFPPDVTHSAIYILRNPLDVAVSTTGHYALDPQRAAKRISKKLVFANALPGLPAQLPQVLHTWSEHVLSWVDQASRYFPVHVVRYEDMHAQPAAAFGQVIAAFDKAVDSRRLHKAIRFSRFEELRAQEEAEGFKERSRVADRFFRQGQVGGYRDVLKTAQIKAIITDHQAVMRRFGYLNDQLEPVY